MSEAWDALVPKLRELHDLSSALRLLHWDQAVMMPPGAAPARARVVATIEGEAHRRLTEPSVGDLLSRLEDDGYLDEIQRASIRVLRRDYDHATKVPEDLVRALAETRGLAYQAWTQARAASDFELLLPHLERLTSLKKQEADALGWDRERYDALLDIFEPGMGTSEVAAMFSELAAGLKPVLDTALGRAGARPQFLSSSYDEERQQSFCLWLVERLGFDTAAGRLDKSPHPFTSAIGPGDVRQTIRTDVRNVLSAIYASLHETGHALYDQGLPQHLVDLPAGRVPSIGIHESQSRLWENQVGRGRAFTDFLLPRLKEFFPDEIGTVEHEEFYWGVNHVAPSLIRVEADELTYDLHIALRFELERALMRDELEVRELPDAWDEAMESHLGIRPADDSSGVLQDMHWSMGAFGYFPTYTLGNIYGAALFAAARRDLGELDAELREGDPTRLLAWLRARIHSQGHLRDAKELVEDVAGEGVRADPLLTYLEEKYAA
jgi:carboxypeptidase Taq